MSVTVSRRCNGGDRGKSKDRRRRKYRLLTKFGDGKRCRCVWCNRWLSFDTLTVDRLLPGSYGGTYQFDNCVPACRRCNSQRGDQLNWIAPRWFGTGPRTAPFIAVPNMQ